MNDYCQKNCEVYHHLYLFQSVSMKDRDTTGSQLSITIDVK